MRLSISRNAAMAAAFCAIVARIFLDLSIDNGAIHGGAWISALLGALPASLYLLGMDGMRIDNLQTGLIRTSAVLLLLTACVIDAAIVLSAIIRSANYLAPNAEPAIVMTIPVALAMLWCVWRNGDAIGYGAMLWSRIFPILLLVVIMLQARHYRVAWLFPLLGNGWRVIAHGGIRSAGWFIPTTAVLFLCEESKDTHDGKRVPPAASLLATGAAIAALMLILMLMMAPADIQADSWQRRLDALLTNGRAPLYLQLPMILLWFLGLLHLLICEYFAVSALLQKLVPGLDGRICAFIADVGCCTMCLSRFSVVGYLECVGPLLLIIGALLEILKIVNRELLKRGGVTTC